jgi:asparagine synthase (glutamine-hydrolysing)
MARQFFGRNLDRWQQPGFAHDTRWHTTSALKRLFSAAVTEANRGADAVNELVASLPAEFPKWTPLAQDQYLEIRTLLSGYLLSSQGDRMLMANSIEGRFPFLDANVIALASSLPASYKLHVLDEKHVLKRASQGIVPEAILSRTKQPYRAPDALSFAGDDAPEWVGEMMSERTAIEAGVFEPARVAQLWKKCRASGGRAQFSNADNMAVVGVLSTHLLHHQLVRTIAPPRAVKLGTLIDRLAP